jgi:hypothetical protein
MEPVLIGLVGTLVGAYLHARFQGREQRRKEISALAEFLEQLSGLLIGMQKELSNGRVPTYEGNKLREMLGRYKETIANSRVSKKNRMELQGILPQLESLLTTAEFEDEVLRGAIITGGYDAASKEKLLLELLRIAARLEGMSAVLKAMP